MRHRVLPVALALVLAVLVVQPAIRGLSDFRQDEERQLRPECCRALGGIRRWWMRPQDRFPEPELQQQQELDGAVQQSEERAPDHRICGYQPAWQERVHRARLQRPQGSFLHDLQARPGEQLPSGRDAGARAWRRSVQLVEAREEVGSPAGRNTLPALLPGLQSRVVAIDPPVLTGGRR